MQSDSEDSLDSAEIENEMLTTEVKHLLSQLSNLEEENSPVKNAPQTLDQFETKLQELMKQKKELEDRISDIQMDQRKKQSQMEQCQNEISQINQQTVKAQEMAKEKQELVKMLSKLLKDL